MGRTYDEVGERLAAFLLAQPVFFVATAPLGPDGHVNCSPKGNRGELALLDPRTVAYLDQTGSGIETVAHLRENGRIVLMFCAFEGPPRIVRLHGTGEVVTAGDRRFAALAARFSSPAGDGVRSVIVVGVRRISDSCGFGVPLMDFRGHRAEMDAWAGRKGRDGIARYWGEKNRASIDALPGLDATVPASPSRG
ncbi:MAG TPA: pyridoxamine 5'-phosphate oxidase family protein [Acidimicrobiales bacterium]|nr:pyridoxamine 5'-phosphate oxidase family protein [Acidimicrobiales bacterium]